MKKSTPLPFTPSEEQREWLEGEKKRTGNGFASILRGLIQEKISEKK